MALQVWRADQGIAAAAGQSRLERIGCLLSCRRTSMKVAWRGIARSLWSPDSSLRTKNGRGLLTIGMPLSKNLQDWNISRLLRRKRCAENLRETEAGQPRKVLTESTATIAASGGYGRGYRVSMSVHLNGYIPRPRIRRAGDCAGRGSGPRRSGVRPSRRTGGGRGSR